MDVRGLRGALTSLALAGAFIVTAAAAQAAPTISLEIASVGPYDVYALNDVETAPIAGTPEFGLSGLGYGTNFNCEWSIAVNPDPSITSTFTLTNISSVTQTFIMNVTLPIAALGPSTVQNGYFGAGTSPSDLIPGTRYTDANNDGSVTLATVGGNPFYSALVNGVVSQNLGFFPDPPGLSASGGPGVYGELSQVTWGPGVYGPASGNIRIHWQFSLTAGDSVSTKGFFQVEPVPEPTSLLLIGLGLAGLVVARKRA